MDGSRAALEALRLPFELRLLEFSEQQPVSIARNACAKLATGSILYFSDDDCLLAADTLEHHLRAQQTPCVTIGSLVFEDGDKRECWQPRRVNYWNLNGANSSVPKTAFMAVGGFDERLKGYGHEDVVFGYQLYQQGLPFCHIADSTVRHMGPNPMRGYQPDKARSAGRNAVIVAHRYPELAFRLGIHPLLIAIKQVSFSPACAWLLGRLYPEWFVYERAYFEGAKEELKRHG